MVTKWLSNWCSGLICGAKAAAHRARADGGGPEAPSTKLTFVLFLLVRPFCLPRGSCSQIYSSLEVISLGALLTPFPASAEGEKKHGLAEGPLAIL